MSSQLTKSRKNLLLVLGVFVVPVILAKIALEQHWFNYGVTNHGHLAKQQLTLDSLGLSHEKFEHQWLVMYRVPKNCDNFCQHLSLAINNTYVLLGKELPRVTPVALSDHEFSTLTLDNFRHHKWITLSLPQQAQSSIKAGEVMIIDPLGNFVMSYDIPTSEQEFALYSKAILADMKKLLKYSRIG